LLQLALGFTSRTSPAAGLGAGVMWQAGRITFDTGYRYKKIFSQSLVDRLLTGRQDLTSHQVVFGVGVRF
jgi:opacity protein-like surface antigen